MIPINGSSQPRIVVGGSPSSGTTHVASLLDSHADIVCGPELSVFSYPSLYGEWRLRDRVFWATTYKTAPNDVAGYGFMGRVTEYGVTHSRVMERFISSKSFVEFSQKFGDDIAAHHKARFWAEKTPANIYCARMFLNEFENSLFVGMVRNPIDMVNSYIRKGNDLFYSVARWLSAAALIRKNLGHARFISLRYEDLVYDREKAINEILEKAGISCIDMEKSINREYASNMTLTTKKSRAWRERPEEMAPVAEMVDDRRLVTRLPNLKLSAEFAKRHEVPEDTVRKLATFFGYEIDTIDEVGDVAVPREQVGGMKQAAISLYFGRQRHTSIVERGRQ